jgi:hypothetical protein
MSQKPIFIGTSGSTDYLRDGTGSQRFWAGLVAPVAPSPFRGDLPEVLRALIADPPILLQRAKSEETD